VAGLWCWFFPALARRDALFTPAPAQPETPEASEVPEVTKRA
jgi:hypothetical protein